MSELLEQIHQENDDMTGQLTDVMKERVAEALPKPGATVRKVPAKTAAARPRKAA